MSVICIFAVFPLLTRCHNRMTTSLVNWESVEFFFLPSFCLFLPHASMLSAIWCTTCQDVIWITSWFHVFACQLFSHALQHSIPEYRFFFVFFFIRNANTLFDYLFYILIKRNQLTQNRKNNTKKRNCRIIFLQLQYKLKSNLGIKQMMKRKIFFFCEHTK